MAQNSALFASARVKSRENKLLGSERLLRMLEAATAADALKVLYEVSFADGNTAGNSGDYQKLLDIELKGLVNFFRSVCPDEKIMHCFMAQYDYHNAKALIKAKYLKLLDTAFMTYDCGLIPLETLKEAINTDSYTFLPKPMAEALFSIDLSYSSNGKNPKFADVELDKAMFKDIFLTLPKNAPADIKNYFTFSADIANILTAIKACQQKLSAKEYEEMFIAGGTVNLKTCLAIFDTPAESRHELFKGTPYREIVMLASEEGITGAETAAANLTGTLYREKRFDVSTVYPLLNYFLTKQAEIKNIKLILTGIAGGADRAEIRKRLRAV